MPTAWKWLENKITLNLRPTYRHNIFRKSTAMTNHGKVLKLAILIGRMSYGNTYSI